MMGHMSDAMDRSTGDGGSYRATESAVCDTIRELLRFRAVSGEVAATAAGVSKTTFYRKLNGRNDPKQAWTLAELTALADLFDVRLTDLINGIQVEISPRSSMGQLVTAGLDPHVIDLREQSAEKKVPPNAFDDFGPSCRRNEFEYPTPSYVVVNEQPVRDGSVKTNIRDSRYLPRTLASV